MEVRRILEDFSAEISKQSPILTEAYGTMLFKCPIISCTRFYQGFTTRQQRDKHLIQHERAHKCIHEGCDYRELGFPTEAELCRHVELCHRVLPEDTTFPNVQRVNLSKALNDAISRDDVQAVRDICSEVLVCPLQQTGFILRAMKCRSISTALILVELLGTDVEMNHKGGKGRTALHEAVLIRNDDLFDRILDTEIDVDVRDVDRFTPFLRALQQGYFHATRLLMNHAAVNLIPDSGVPVRHIYYEGMKDVAAGGVNDIPKTLFPNFVSVTKGRFQGQTEKHMSDDLTRIIAKAASNRHEATVKLILELARALDLENMYQKSLKKELHHGIVAMTVFFMQRYGEAKRDIGKNRDIYCTDLANAAINDDFALVMRLLKDGADIDCADAAVPYNALGAAASQGHLSMVSLLVEQGADINAKGGYSGNALYLACREKHMAVVDFLFENSADVNARLLSDDTALITASLVGRFDAAQLLIGKGADINLQNKFGETALFKASRNGHIEIVKILVQGGACVSLQNQYGRTALGEAFTRGHNEIIDILVLGGVGIDLQNTSLETALFKASRDGHKELVEILVQRGADLNRQNISGDTALSVAFKEGNREMVQVLIEAEGLEAALSAAFIYRHRDILQLLLKQASRSQQRVSVRLFLDTDTDVYAPGGVYDDALSFACSFGLEESVEVLLEEGAKSKIPIEIHDRALGLIGSRCFLMVDEYEAIDKLLRKRRATTALPD